MWIVRLALRRPYTFVVMAMLIILLGVFAILRMPTDIFPEVDIPVISVIFKYDGMSPEELEGRIVRVYEGILTTTVNDIEHIESQSINGEAIIRIYFQPGAKIAESEAQVTAVSQTALRTMPPGVQPPLIMRYSASTVPIVWLSMGSNTQPEQQLFDIFNNFLRPELATVQGAMLPWPYGGKQRQVMVDLEPDKLYAFGLSPSDISNAINEQNIIVPSGEARIGTQDYPVRLNASPDVLEALNDIPVKTIGGTTVLVKDVAHVSDKYMPQINMVHIDGKKGALEPVYKLGGASTLDIVKRVRAKLPEIMPRLPHAKEVKITPIFDQSIFVRAAVSGVVKEAAIAAGLTGLMILLFLGSWRSTLIICVSIPLSILVSIIILWLLDETLNVMTLGGMALAVGILVDDATVEIENIHRNLHQGKRLVQAILDGASQIAVPAFVSTLCICIVFVPVWFISGPAKSLFTPLAMAVVFAMMTSYLLSRTLVPTLVHYLLASEVELYGGVEEGGEHHEVRKNWLWRFHEGFNRQFEKLRRFYGGFLAWTLEHRLTVLGVFTLFVVGSLVLYPMVGRDFFPSVDAGQVRLHVRAPAGTRLEESEKYFGRVEDFLRSQIPSDEIDVMLDNIGIPNSGINFSLSDGSQISPADGEILINLKPEHHATPDYVKKLRKTLPQKFPELSFWFQPADIATQVLNFGLPAPIDVQVLGPKSNVERNREVAEVIRREIESVPGAVDVHVHQVANTPDLRINVDRTLASQIGVTQRDVANDLLISLSSSGQTQPNFWLDPKRGVSYSVAVMTPDYRMDKLTALSSTPLAPVGGDSQLLSNLATITRGTSATNVSHYNIQPTIDVQMNVQGTDLGSVAKQVGKIVDDIRARKNPDQSSFLPEGSSITIRGQAESMETSFRALTVGILGAVLLVYLLMVINFQSWLDPLIILMALPGAIAGILWMLFASRTTISVPSLMGSIMCMGVATANSILMITFANDQRKVGFSAHDAALAAGMTRLRPVIMTALAMVIGMLPMALGLGEGGEQNAPLGRAVIGGLAVATFFTLFFVPIVYSTMRKHPPHRPIEPELQEP